MTKQEKIGEGIYYVPQSNKPVIQEGIARWLHSASTNPWKEPDWKELPEWRKDQYRKNAYFLMVKLDGMGIVIKVKVNLPSDIKNLAWDNGKKVFTVAAVEPLIEEEK